MKEPTPSRTDALRQTLRIFDGALRQPILQRLGLRDITCLLRDIADFHQQARHPLPTQPPSERTRLIAAGCRLSSDLNEALISQLVDTLQQQDQTIEQLSAQLRDHVQARAKAMRLLNQAQSLQQQTAETAEASGLGCIL